MLLCVAWKIVFPTQRISVVVKIALPVEFNSKKFLHNDYNPLTKESVVFVWKFISSIVFPNSIKF